ncbi:copper resistance CopC/CopD family protein [Nocardia jejuensis]|uniref:copper resistance CopC/CopD family protein n=1 Tax=Nocardia jejuensis TaxID=328049 RepID=UPI00083363F0|nr:copper resistance protein CopC [Nocardia jejuensis]
MRKAAIRVVAVAGFVLAVVWGGAGTAAAHAVLVSSDPGYGATLSQAPEQVSMTFDEPVTAARNSVTVADRDGVRVDTGEVRGIDGGRTVVVPLRAGLSDGTYLLGWSLLSADGHLVAGSIVFGIGAPPDLSVTGAPPDPLIAALDTVVRLLTGLGYLGIALAVGVPPAVYAIQRRASDIGAVVQLARIGAALTAVTALLIFAATPARLAGTAGWTDPQIWKQSATSVIGAAALVRAAAAVALLWLSKRSIAQPSRWTTAGRVAVLAPGSAPERTIPDARQVWGADRRGSFRVVASVLVVVSTAVAGHAVAGEYRWIALVSVALHLVAMAVWIGGVAVVILLWRTDGRGEAVARFGRVAVLALGAVVVSGALQTWRAVSPVAALWHTSWGLLLLVKLALVGVALGIAVVVRRTARVGAARLEFGAQVAVLVVSALLTGVAPARDSYDPAVTLAAELGPLAATIAVDGAHAGTQELTVRLRDSAGEPVDALEVSGRLVRDDGALGPIEIPFRRVEPVELGPDYFVSQPVRVPLAGDWHLRLTVVADRVNGYAATLPYRVW